MAKPAQRKKSQCRRQAAYERRQRRGLAIYPVELSQIEIATLARLGWLADEAIEDRQIIF